MRIGLILKNWEMEGVAPSWDQMRAQAVAAESAGFDLFVLADAITFDGAGFWEAMTLGGALARETSTIRLSHSVVNPPLRSTAVVARAAQTLDEISGGRYTLGIGAGNSPDDYPAFAIPADPRYSRFAEYLPVVADLLRHGTADREGEYYPAKAEAFEMLGQRSIPINVAAGGPKMLRLAAEYADEWNWWGGAVGHPEHLDETIPELEKACEEVGRDPSTLVRTLDVYSFDPLRELDEPPDHVHTGSADEITESLLAYRAFGVEEVRLSFAGGIERTPDAIEAMAPVAEALHAA